MTTWLLDGSGSVPEVELELLDGQVASLDEGGSIHDDGQGTSLDDGGCTHDEGGSIHEEDGQGTSLDDGTTQDDEGSTSDDELIHRLELDQPEELPLQLSQQQHPAWWLTAQEPSSRVNPPFSIRSVTVRW
jgi:hypothetical protein